MQEQSIFLDNPVMEGDRVWTSVALYDPRDGQPFIGLDPSLRLQDPAGEVTTVGIMVETDDPGHYELNYIVDSVGEWTSIVRVPPPREATFEKQFYVSSRIEGT